MNKIIIFALCLCALPILGMSATAQETNQTTESEIYDQLGDLKIETVNYDGTQFEITMQWTGEAPESVSLTELIELDSAGSTGISLQQQRLLPGESTTVTIAAEQSGGTAAVIVSTETSISNGNALVIQEGTPTAREPVPFDIAGLFVALTAAGTFGVGISILYRRRNKDESQRGRVL